MASIKDPFEFQGTCSQIYFVLCKSRTRVYPAFFLFEIFLSSLCSRTEFDEGENLLDSNSDAVAISIEDPGSRPQKQTKSDGFTLNDEDPDVSDDQTKVWKRCRNVNYAKMSTF